MRRVASEVNKESEGGRGEQKGERSRSEEPTHQYITGMVIWCNPLPHQRNSFTTFLTISMFLLSLPPSSLHLVTTPTTPTDYLLSHSLFCSDHSNHLYFFSSLSLSPLQLPLLSVRNTSRYLFRLCCPVFLLFIWLLNLSGYIVF